MRNLRAKSGYNRHFIAEKLRICPDYFSQIEAGRGAMPIKRAKVLAKLYNCPLDEILETWRDLHDSIEKKI